MQITTGGPHFSVPKYCYVLAHEETLHHLFREAPKLGMEVKNLRETNGVNVRRGDLFFVEAEAVRAEDAEWLEEIAKLGCGRADLLLLPFSRTAENTGEVVRALLPLFPTDSHFLEYQAVIWKKITADRIREAVDAFTQSNIRSIRDALIDVGSLFYMLGAFAFGPISPVISLVIVIWHVWVGDVGTWRYVVWFLSGPSIFMLLAVRLNALQTIQLCSAAYFIVEAASTGLGIVWLLPILAVSRAVFAIWHRIREYMDIRDLLRCVFSREIVERNPEFQIPRKPPSVGSGEFILWRLGRLRVWRFFDTQSMSRVFISHRNSEDGIKLAERIQENLNATGEWDAFLERKRLLGGRWRDQLADGFYGNGVLICILTPDAREKLRWVRRELFAACLKYASYGTPIPIIVEYGLTLDELLRMEEEQGHRATPLHRLAHALPIVQWSNEMDDEQNLKQVRRQVQASVTTELRQQSPTFLREGLGSVASQLFWPSLAVLVASFFWRETKMDVYRYLTIASLAVLFTDFAGISVGGLLPRWAGGTAMRTGWFKRAAPSARPFQALLTIGLTFALLITMNWPAPLTCAVLTGLSINLLDHELWQTSRALSTHAHTRQKV